MVWLCVFTQYIAYTYTMHLVKACTTKLFYSHIFGNPHAWTYSVYQALLHTRGPGDKANIKHKFLLASCSKWFEFFIRFSGDSMAIFRRFLSGFIIFICENECSTDVVPTWFLLGHIVCSTELVDICFSCSLMPSFGWLAMCFGTFQLSWYIGIDKRWHYEFFTKHWFC